MEKNLKINKNESSNKYLTDEKRKQLLTALHSRLFWVGQYTPNIIDMGEETATYITMYGNYPKRNSYSDRKD